MTDNPLADTDKQLVANRFAVIFEIDATDKSKCERTQMKELGVNTVKAGKIVREEFCCTV